MSMTALRKYTLLLRHTRKVHFQTETAESFCKVLKFPTVKTITSQNANSRTVFNNFGTKKNWLYYDIICHFNGSWAIIEALYFSSFLTSNLNIQRNALWLVDFVVYLNSTASKFLFLLICLFLSRNFIMKVPNFSYSWSCKPNWLFVLIHKALKETMLLEWSFVVKNVNFKSLVYFSTILTLRLISKWDTFAD